MGTWGSGVFENDHALDLHFTEVKRLIQEVEYVLSLEPVAFSRLETTEATIPSASIVKRARFTTVRWMRRSPSQSMAFSWQRRSRSCLRAC